MLICFHNNRQQWTKQSLCVFPAKAGDTKKLRTNLVVKMQCAQATGKILGGFFFFFVCLA